jgi:hypothetical protein
MVLNGMQLPLRTDIEALHSKDTVAALKHLAALCLMGFLFAPTIAIRPKSQ